jgi:hypothetical protein
MTWASGYENEVDAHDAAKNAATQAAAQQYRLSLLQKSRFLIRGGEFILSRPS